MCYGECGEGGGGGGGEEGGGGGEGRGRSITNIRKNTGVTLTACVRAVSIRWPA